MQALEHLLSLKSNSIEACEALNHKINAQTTPFQLPFDISDLTRRPMMDDSGNTCPFRPPGMQVSLSNTMIFKDKMELISNPKREFRRHLVEKQEGEDESLEMSARMNTIYTQRASFKTRPSGGSVRLPTGGHKPISTQRSMPPKFQLLEPVEENKM